MNFVPPVPLQGSSIHVLSNFYANIIFFLLKPPPFMAILHNFILPDSNSFFNCQNIPLPIVFLVIRPCSYPYEQHDVCILEFHFLNHIFIFGTPIEYIMIG